MDRRIAFGLKARNASTAPVRLQVLYVLTHLLLFAALSVFFERPAQAYTDPGSALLLFQGVSAFVTGALFYFRRRLRSLFGRRSREKSSKSSL